jgi:hypothetical protein
MLLQSTFEAYIHFYLNTLDNQLSPWNSIIHCYPPNETACEGGGDVIDVFRATCTKVLHQRFGGLRYRPPVFVLISGLTKSKYGHMLRPWRQWMVRLSSLAYTFDLRSGHIGKNVALWSSVKPVRYSVTSSPWRHGSWIDVLLGTSRGSVRGHIFVSSVLETYATRRVCGLCSRNYRQERSISRIRSSDLFKMACENIHRKSQLWSICPCRRCHLFGFSGDISCVGGGEPELEKLARGKFVESRLTGS